ncbi:hypothetical protein Salat_1705200 [Sesamum alatum]|uniref:Uncharacterized protein n=1 Tax=Sesamum alatum TaxID=300844 RepID=A0AAE1Y832_9LAMI|nr:hypothetical protein Salat_1705200 [Sesamum alatum]
MAEDEDEDEDEGEDEDEAASWLLLNPMIKNDDEDQSNNDNGVLFAGGSDKYLTLDHYNSCQRNQFNHGYCNQQQECQSFLNGATAAVTVLSQSHRLHIVILLQCLKL